MSDEDDGTEDEVLFLVRREQRQEGLSTEDWALMQAAVLEPV